MARLSRLQACAILSSAGIVRGADFHVLSSSKVDDLVKWAKHERYRKPKNANGSTARYFHAKLQRMCK